MLKEFILSIERNKHLNKKKQSNTKNNLNKKQSIDFQSKQQSE